MRLLIVPFMVLTATGLLAGAFVFTCLNIVPTFYEVPVNVHLVYRVQLMNHNGLVMQSLMGISIITCLYYAYANRRIPQVRNLAFLAFCFVLTSLLVTRFGNVPINQVIRTWLPDAPPDNWKALLHRWDIFHGIRTGASCLGFMLFMAAMHFYYKNESGKGVVRS